MPIPALARPRLVAAASLALLLLLGCGSAKPVTVTGKLILPGKVKVAESDSLSVVFVPEDSAKGKSGTATVNPQDLTFSGQVLPGNYKVAVTVTPYAGMKDTDARTELLEKQMGAFSSTSTSLRYEVTKEASQSITVDLTKPSVTTP